MIYDHNSMWTTDTQFDFPDVSSNDTCYLCNIHMTWSRKYIQFESDMILREWRIRRGVWRLSWLIATFPLPFKWIESFQLIRIQAETNRNNPKWIQFLNYIQTKTKKKHNNKNLDKNKNGEKKRGKKMMKEIKCKPFFEWFSALADDMLWFQKFKRHPKTRISLMRSFILYKTLVSVRLTHGIIYIDFLFVCFFLCFFLFICDAFAQTR